TGPPRNVAGALAGGKAGSGGGSFFVRGGRGGRGGGWPPPPPPPPRPPPPPPKGRWAPAEPRSLLARGGSRAPPPPPPRPRPRAAAVTAAAPRAPRQPAVPAQLHDGRVQRPSVPLVGAVDEHGHHLGVHLDLHGFTPYRIGSSQLTSPTPRITPTNPATTLPA